MGRITPRTCLWPLAGSLSCTFALSIGLTFRSNKHCYAGTCGEWLFPLQARIHVVVWYCWLSTSVTFLAIRSFHSPTRKWLRQSLSRNEIPVIGKHLAVSGVIVLVWIISLYGIIVGIWWMRLHSYFSERGLSGGVTSGNGRLAAIALTGHLCDVTMGMVLIPISRHSALASFFKISVSTTLSFHMLAAYTLFALVCVHGLLYVSWLPVFLSLPATLRRVYPVLNPTYLYRETWPGNISSLGVWRASLVFTGTATTLIFLLIFVTTIPAIRKKNFNLFYFTHLAAIMAVLLICLHASTMLYCTSPGLAMWCLDWGMRLWELRTLLHGNIESLGKGWYRLTLPLSRRRLAGCATTSPLAHFYIHHADSSVRELHPFTTTTHLASQNAITPRHQDDISISFLFRKRGKLHSPEITATSSSKENCYKRTLLKGRRLLNMSSGRKGGQWTERLASIAGGTLGLELMKPTKGTDDGTPKIPISVRLEGPYFTNADPTRYKTVVCLVAGTGVSGALAIATAFKHIEAQPLSLDHLQPDLYPMPLCDSCGHDSCGHSITLFSQQKETWKRCIVVWSVREEDYIELDGFSAPPTSKLEVRPHFTGKGRERCNMGSVLDSVLATGGREGGGIWVYISGPNAFIAKGEEACMARQERGVEWYGARWDT